jgi:DNA-binding MarR family transcriptional regulator
MNNLRDVSKCSQRIISSDELNELLAISQELEHERLIAKEFNTHRFYMQFLELSLANQHKNSRPILTLNEQHLLEQIAVRCEMDKPISVIDLCVMRQFGCSSTIHHLIHKLGAADLIFLDSYRGSKRKKLISLSPAGRQYFREIEARLEVALSI